MWSGDTEDFGQFACSRYWERWAAGRDLALALAE